MQFIGFELSGLLAVSLIGVAVLTLLAAALIAAAVLLGAFSVFIFLRTRKVFIPRLTLFVLSFLEVPIKHLLWLFGVDAMAIDQMLVQIRNGLYHNAYSNVPFNKRAVFLPQCLRSSNCPAKLTPEGIKCIQCGQCGIGEVKKIAESMGYMFFIVPGSSFVKRMVQKYKPDAILGVGCPMEVKEGTSMMASIGLPVQGVMLLKDGCVDTRVSVEELLKKLYLSSLKAGVDPKEVERVSGKWGGEEPKVFVKVKK